MNLGRGPYLVLAALVISALAMGGGGEVASRQSDPDTGQCILFAIAISCALILVIVLNRYAGRPGDEGDDGPGDDGPEPEFTPPPEDHPVDRPEIRFVDTDMAAFERQFSDSEVK